MAPDEIFLYSSDHSFGIGIAFGIRLAGKKLLDTQIRTGLHRGNGRWLTAIIRYQIKRFYQAVFDSFGKTFSNSPL